MKVKEFKKEIKRKSAVELQKVLAEKVAELRNFRFGLAGSKSRNIKEGKNLKRNIARIKTELSSKN